MEATSAPRPHGLRIPKPRRLLAALSDDRLVEHVRHGEVAAFEVLYDRYSAGILGFCRHMLGSAADAEDAVQHTFIAAHSDIQRHERRDLHVKAWLYTIARNRCLSMLRARREQASEDAADVVTDNLLGDIEQRADLRALLADVSRLPDDQREALVLSEIGDLSHSDISAVLGCEVSKVKSLVFQARTALIDRRTARETPCAEIREQLATLRGGALRRSHLRHHLEACPGCSEYRDEVRRQRAMLAIALPVVPSAALKANVLSGLGFGGGGSAAAAGGGAAGMSAASGLGVAAQGGLAKLGVAAVLAVSGVGGAAVATNGDLPLLRAITGHESSTGAGGNTGTQAGTTAGTAASMSAAAAKKHTVAGSRRSAKGTEHGFTPVTGESNGARAREFAKTRGKGSETSAAAKRRHVTAHKRAKPVRPTHVKHVAAPPKSGARTAPAKPVTTAPKSTAPAPAPAPAPTPTATQPAPAPAPEQTTSTPAPGSGSDNGTTGNTLGSGKRTAAAG